MPVGGALEVGQVSHEDCWESPQRPVTFAELRVGGIDFPAAVVSELELNAYEIERV